MNRVACIGDIAIDHYVDLSTKHIGGISFNLAWNLAECGASPCIISAVGSDRDGVALIQTLSRRGIPTHGILVKEGDTALQRIAVNRHGERVFDGYRPGVLSQLSLDACSHVSWKDFDAVHAPLSDGLEGLFDAVARSSFGAPKIADFSLDGPNPRGVMASVESYAPFFDLMFIGGRKEDLTRLAQLAAAFSDKIFVITLGKDGAECFTGGLRFAQIAVPEVAVVDTTGCGDAFQGAFIAHWLRDRSDIVGALRAGAAQGAKVAAFLGATGCVVDNDPVAPPNA